MNAPRSPLAPNLTVERAVLGALLLSDNAYWSVADVLKQEHFAFSINGKIFGAIKSLCEGGQKISLSRLIALIGEEYDDGKSVPNLLGALLRDAEQSEDGSVWHTFVEDIIENWRKRQIKEQVDWAAKRVLESGVHSDDVINDLKSRVEAIETNSQSIPIKWIGNLAEEAVRFSKNAKESGVLPGFDTGLPSLDEIVGRIHAGDLGVVGARQGDGKTLIAAQLAKRAAQYGTVAFFQLEMTAVDMARRALAEESNLSASEIEEGAFDMFAMEQLVSSLSSLKNVPIIIDDRPKQMLDNIISRVKALKKSHGVHAVFIDHMRLIRVKDKVSNRLDKFPIITEDLKAAAKDIGVAIVLLSQVLRQAQRRDEPTLQLADLDGGGSLEQDADWVIGAWRWDRFLKTREPTNGSEADWSKWRDKYNKHKGRIELCGLKRRRGGDGLLREFEFDGRLSCIREIEK